MSYDLQIWSAEPVALPPSPDGWSREGEAWLRAGRGSTVTIWTSTPAESEDAPDDVAAAIPGIAWVTELNLHPFDAPAKAVADLTKLARKLAMAGRGAVYDPQTDTADCPRGAKRFVAPERDAPGALLTLSWWFDQQAFSAPESFGQFLELLETLLPEALPRRYGTIEPPEYRYEPDGRPALERFLHAHGHDFILWYANAPVIDVDFSLTREWGSNRDGFRTNYLSVTVDAAVLAQPGWERQLRKFWRGVSLSLKPFYGDVRTLGGYRRSGGRYQRLLTTMDRHPVHDQFWTGLPPDIGHAAVVGEPYAGLWPGLAGIAEFEGGLGFIGTRAWHGENAVDPFAGCIPPDLADPDPIPLRGPGRAILRLDRPYPKIWPFEPPYDPTRM
jgi:hypothetical protein